MRGGLIRGSQVRVLGGMHRYIRNLMYVAILAVIIGQALLLGQLGLLLYPPPSGCSPRYSSAGTRNLLSSVGSVPTTRPTGVRCPLGDSTTSWKPTETTNLADRELPRNRDTRS